MSVCSLHLTKAVSICTFIQSSLPYRLSLSSGWRAATYSVYWSYAENFLGLLNFVRKPDNLNHAKRAGERDLLASEREIEL
jgi:hypothetical protein